MATSPSQNNTAPKSLSPYINGASCSLRHSKSGDFSQVIPHDEAQTGKNLVLCFDGTRDQYDNDNSNIVRLFQTLKKDDRSKQRVYYQTGIGTGVGSKGSASSLFNKISDAVDSAVATALETHVIGGYEFLMQNYTAGDRISIFGFSRGAYTARLLPAHNYEQVKFAYRMYKRDDEKGWQMSDGFKRAYSIDVKIDFVGVFDTVNSVGVIPRELPFAKSNSLIRVFRHAVALDEHRIRFAVDLWSRATEQEETLGSGGKHPKYSKSGYAGSRSAVCEHIPGGYSERDRGRTKAVCRSGLLNRNGEDSASSVNKRQTDVKEVWFAGGHCDVGGGAVENDKTGDGHDLARIPLRWMIRECFLNSTGILFHSSELDAIGLDPMSLWPTVKIPNPPDLKTINMYEDSGHFERHTAEATGVPAADASPSDKLIPAEKIRLWSEQDEKDALQEIHDQLSEKPWWWILEFWPTRQSYQRHDGTWRTWFSINMGRPRVIHGQKEFPTYVHRSVLYRMQQSDYKPRAELLKEPGPVWVD